MALIPVLAIVAKRVSPLMEGPRELDAALTIQPEPQKQHAIVVGYGRVGRVVCAMLDQHGVAYTVVDHDSNTVTAERAKGHSVFFGDATSPAFLKACGLIEASGVIVTIHTKSLIDEVVREVRKAKPDILVVARARDAEHARHLYAIGVTDAVPETIEASLQLSEAALVGLGIPTGLVIATIHEKRDEFKNALRAAAEEAALSEPYSIRAKT